LPNKSRIYQHPVLRSGSLDYVDSSTFESIFEVKISGESVKDTVQVSYTLQIRNKSLLALLDKGQASIYLAFYSAETLFKQLIQIKELRGQLQLQRGAVLGSLEIEPLIVASQKIIGFSPPGINKEYGNIQFEIERGAPLAIGERDIFPISFARRTFQDLIRVQTSTELDKNEYEISIASNVITIIMGINVRQAWELMSADSSYRPFLFISIYKDTFLEALLALVSGDDVEEFAWAKKLIDNFEKVGLDISRETDFATLNRAVLRLLGKKGVEQVITNVG
jgi:hypothetical protein